jgi:hypothetical protein
VLWVAQVGTVLKLALLVGELLLLLLQLLLLLVVGRLAELLLLELGSGSLKLDMALLLAICAWVLGRVWRVINVRGDLTDTGVQLEVLIILQGQFLVRSIEHEVVSEVSRRLLGRWNGRRDLGLPVERLLLQRDLGNTGPDRWGRVAHSLRGSTSKTASIVVSALLGLLALLLGIHSAVVATGQDVLDELPSRLLLWRGTLG